METVKKKAVPISSLCILAGLLLFFWGMLLRYGVGIYNDSEQYITMHIHREPLYPLFLALFRKLCGETYLRVTMAAQGILTAIGIWTLTEYLTVRFRLRLWEELLLTVLQLAPHLVTRYVSAMHIFMENSVMSEALCLPLFSFFLYFLLRMLLEKKPRDAALSMLFAWLLSMTRGQMMTTILLTALLLAGRLLIDKKYQMLFIPIAAVIFAFVMRILAVHVYNYGVTGYFIGNTYGKVNTLTNVLYACDEEDREVFAEGSLEQLFFDQFYAESMERGLNHIYGGGSFGERVAHLEESHDRIKFDIVEAGFSAYYYARGEDYYGQSTKADEVAAKMIEKLLPVCFGQWLYDYILLVRNGFVRSIAVVHPFITPIAFLLYFAAAGMMLFLFLRTWRTGRETPDLRGRQAQPLQAAVVMCVALLFIAANVCATSLTIMCLSRYMIYGFSLFYIAFYLILREVKYGLQGNHI